MNIRDQELIDALAAQYVLGTLRGPAARRFQKLLGQDLIIRQAVRAAERRLTPLAASVAPVTPRAFVWERIEAALGQSAAPRPTAQRSSPTPWLIAAAISMLAIASTWFALNQEPELVTATYVSVLNDNAAEPGWLAEVYTDSRRLSLRSVADASPPDGRVFELWMLPADGRPPSSLGVITNIAAVAVDLSDEQLTLLAQSSALAISIEPPGGSPTGVPTGDVVFVGTLVSG